MNVAIIQLTSDLDYKVNLEKIKTLFFEYKDHKEIEALFLPECFYSMSDGTRPTPYLVESGNEHYENIKQLAKDLGVALIGGSAAALYKGKVVNRAYNFTKEGKDLGHYDKINLFSCDLTKPDDKGKNRIINESDIYTPGFDEKLIEFDQYKVGLGICFDIRFPEMLRRYSAQGAEIITAASAFTVPTGKAHWEILIRARAIENQCFMVAPAQWGHNNDRIQTYGHSMIVNPWGEVLANAKEGEKLIAAQLDKSEIERVRKAVKVFK